MLKNALLPVKTKKVKSMCSMFLTPFPGNKNNAMKLILIREREVISV